VTVAVRTGANVVPRDLAGIPIQYIVFAMRRLPKSARQEVARLVGRLTELRRGKPVLPKPPYGPLDAIPLIGFHLVDAIRSGRIAVRPSVAELTETGVRFTDGVEEPFDDVIHRIEQACGQVDRGAGILILVDVHGSSPFQACMAMVDGTRPLEIVCGVNLPMLIKLATVDRSDLAPAEMAELLREVGRRSIRLGSELTGKVALQESR